MNDQFRKVIGTMLETSYDCLTTDDLVPTVENIQLMNSSLNLLTLLVLHEGLEEIVQLDNTPLLDNILKYSRCLESCASRMPWESRPCDCGWDEFREVLESCR